jgi:hypothetical protein
MTAPKPPLILTHDERLSPLWRKLVAHMTEQVDQLRQSNDADRSETETARLRGRIAAYKAMLELNKEPDQDAPAPVTHGF